MIILQSFYWNCLDNWWEELNYLVESIAEKGFDTMWLPPPSRGMGGEHSMGYDIKEHYNLNSKFGNRASLEELIDKCHRNDIEVMGDLVMGHMLGGELEYNPLDGNETYTKFPEEKFPKNYRHFHFGSDDINEFGETINYYSDDNYMKDGLVEWADWLNSEIGFDSFRLDNLKDMDLEFISFFISYFEDNFIVGEFWDGSDDRLEEIYDKTECKLFNFPLFYKMKEVCINPDYPICKLEDITKENRVNFLSNHDIERRERSYNKDAIYVNKEIGYAYIMFQEQSLVVAWEDYFDYGLKSIIDELINIRKDFKRYPLNVLYTDKNIYHAERGGYELIINNADRDIFYRDFNIDSQSFIVIDWNEKVVLGLE